MGRPPHVLADAGMSAGSGTAKRVCLLTGASGRLGTLFCRMHARTYDIVAVHRRRPLQVASQDQAYVDPLDPERTLPENAHPVFAIQANLTVEQEVRHVVERAMQRFGTVDLLVNAAVHSVWGSVLEGGAVLESARSQLATNVYAPLLLSALLARSCWMDDVAENRRRDRHIVNVSSLAGVQVFPGWGQGVYSASKAALNFLTWHMADEFLKISVRVNGIAPDAFPRKIATERVVDRIVDLDRGTRTGMVVAMRPGGDSVLRAPGSSTEQGS